MFPTWSFQLKMGRVDPHSSACYSNVQDVCAVVCASLGVTLSCGSIGSVFAVARVGHSSTDLLQRLKPGLQRSARC